MGFLSDLVSFAANWITIAVVMVALGIAAGLLVFVYVSPGQPKIGVIDIPYTVITDDSAYVISEYLTYAREDDSIKGVVIKITSPGGGAASSERLYRETERLAQEKPVVLVMNWLVASGGYFMAMGATHTYAQTSSLVGNVGVVSFQDPLVPPLDRESLLITGPYKGAGFSRDQWFESLEDLKEAFAQVVVSERGDRLRISQEELTEGRLYTGVDAVRLGLADELGGNSDAMEKAAELSGISNYGLVDVNLEVLKKFVKELRDVYAISSDENVSADALALMDTENGPAGSTPGSASAATNASLERMNALRGLILYGRLGSGHEDPPPGFPLELNHPDIYYLYIGNAP